MGSRARPVDQLRDWTREHSVELIRAAYGIAVLGLLVAAILGSVLGWRAVNTVGVLGFLSACLVGSLVESRDTRSPIELLVGAVISGFVLVIAWGMLSDRVQLTNIGIIGLIIFVVGYAIVAASVNWWQDNTKQRPFDLVHGTYLVVFAGLSLIAVFEWNGEARPWALGGLLLAGLVLTRLWWRVQRSSPGAAAARLTSAYGPSHQRTTQRDWQHGLARCRQCNRSVDARWDPGQQSDGLGIKAFTCPRCGALTHFHTDGA